MLSASPLTGESGVYCFLGSPESCLFSPDPINSGFQKLGISKLCCCVSPPEEAEPEALLSAVRTLGIKGCRLSAAHRTAMAKCVDELSGGAALCGSINVLLNENGRLTGFNTEGAAFARALSREDVSVSGKVVAISGGGVAARAVAAQAALDGASAIFFIRRMGEKISETLACVGALSARAPDCQVRMITGGGGMLKEIFRSVDIFVNATPVGMYPNQNDIPQEASYLHAGTAVVELVYNPRETRLLAEARAKGCVCVEGTRIKRFQMHETFLLFAGREYPA